MQETVRLELVDCIEQMSWAIGKYFSIYDKDKVVDYIKTYEFSKATINDCMDEDYAYYMNEDTRIQEDLCNFMYHSINDKKVLFIDELFIQNNYFQVKSFVVYLDCLCFQR